MFYCGVCCGEVFFGKSAITRFLSRCPPLAVKSYTGKLWIGETSSPRTAPSLRQQPRVCDSNQWLDKEARAEHAATPHPIFSGEGSIYNTGALKKFRHFSVPHTAPPPRLEMEGNPVPAPPLPLVGAGAENMPVRHTALALPHTPPHTPSAGSSL